MKKQFIILSAIAVLSAAGCSDIQKKEKSEPPTVETVTAGSGAEALQAGFVGTVVPAKESSIMALHAGRVVSISVREGQAVREGQEIARVESQNVRSMYETTQAQLRQAEDGLRRVSQVHSTGGVADVKLVEVESKVAQARAQASAAAKALDECVVRAPYAGVISSVDVEEGVEITSVNRVAHIMEISDPRIEISLPENGLSAVRMGDTARVTVAALGAEFPAVVSSRGVAGSALAHTYKCVLRPTAGHVAGMMPGMLCKVFFPSDISTEALFIPAEALCLDAEGRYVWTVEEDNTVAKRRITTGEYRGAGVEVLGGLEAGCRVIVRGRDKVSTGVKVIIEKAAAR